MQLRSAVFLLCLLANSMAQAALTKAQVKQVESSVNQMEGTLRVLMGLAYQAEKAIDAGNTFTTDFSTVSFSLSAQQQQDIVNYYQSLKTKLQTQYNTLP